MSANFCQPPPGEAVRAPPAEHTRQHLLEGTMLTSTPTKEQAVQSPACAFVLSSLDPGVGSRAASRCGCDCRMQDSCFSPIWTFRSPQDQASASAVALLLLAKRRLSAIRSTLSFPVLLYMSTARALVCRLCRENQMACARMRRVADEGCAAFVNAYACRRLWAKDGSACAQHEATGCNSLGDSQSQVQTAAHAPESG